MQTRKAFVWSYIMQINQSNKEQSHSTSLTFGQTIEQQNKIYKVAHAIRHSLKRKKYCFDVFLDLHKCILIDRVWHKGFLCKFTMCLPHHVYMLLRSLEDPMFQVRSGNYLSLLYPIEAAVPQGSVLGSTPYSVHCWSTQLKLNCYCNLRW